MILWSAEWVTDPDKPIWDKCSSGALCSCLVGLLDTNCDIRPHVDTCTFVSIGTFSRDEDIHRSELVCPHSQYKKCFECEKKLRTCISFYSIFWVGVQRSFSYGKRGLHTPAIYADGASSRAVFSGKIKLSVQKNAWEEEFAVFLGRWARGLK